MTTGTKSLLFGVHQFAWHPFTVWLAWIWLYKKLPTFWETVAIIVHDWGYWGCEKMDDKKGELHPHVGARLMLWLRLKVYGERRQVKRTIALWRLCIFHSRYLSAKYNAEPSKLCWADKGCMKFDPAWFYLLRAYLSGELREYRCNASGVVPATASNFEWYRWIQNKCVRHALYRETAAQRQHT